ncbi:hypothetical protein DEO72_LG1g884 [Vigna unguiculata]|uniref:Replication factor A C-terminal domain-containing protein n=1 Tax=Vigna unguiculata TaxID=3917 RepID=A0A4D6KIY8_VIGUN|nr:hypothetical protein DEO72_LG1g884 [Vigna unguiculata]
MMIVVSVAASYLSHSPDSSTGLNSDLRQYFANTQFSHIVLYGPKARVECKLLIRPRSVKIGSGWKRFREVHGLEEKDLILFEVDSQQASNDVNCLLLEVSNKVPSPRRFFGFSTPHFYLTFCRDPTQFLHLEHVSHPFTYSYKPLTFPVTTVPNQSQSVSEVSPQKENWNIIARVIRSWFVPDFTKQRCPFSMEFVIQDKETSKNTVEEDFLTLTPRTAIQGLKDCKEVTTYILFGTIKHILVDDDWWYTACVCNKAVYPDSKMFFCEKCNKHVIKVFPRYRIKIRVIDSSDSTTFVLFDRDTTTLFKKTCADMLDAHDKMNSFGNLPKQFDELVDRSLLFKVESRNDQNFKLEQSFRVKKICVDDDIIEKFNDSSLKSVDLLVQFTKETIECGSQSPELIQDNPTNDDANSSHKRESGKKTASLESIEEDNVPLKLLKRNIKKEKSVI